jgi:hypothetical protein
VLGVFSNCSPEFRLAHDEIRTWSSSSFWSSSEKKSVSERCARTRGRRRYGGGRSKLTVIGNEIGLQWDAAVSGCSSLAALFARVLERGVHGGEGVYMDVMAWQRG